jgi:hypothetical protein
MENQPKYQSQHNQQANFNWGKAAATAGGIFTGWKLFGGNKNESESNPVLFWSIIGLLAIGLIFGGIYTYKKLLK